MLPSGSLPLALLQLDAPGAFFDAVAVPLDQVLEQAFVCARLAADGAAAEVSSVQDLG